MYRHLLSSCKKKGTSAMCLFVFMKLLVNIEGDLTIPYAPRTPADATKLDGFC